jgi:hypothetical protein
MNEINTYRISHEIDLTTLLYGKACLSIEDEGVGVKGVGQGLLIY